MPLSTRHQYRKALLDEQQTKSDDIKQHKPVPISTHYNYGCSQARKLPANSHHRATVNYNYISYIANNSTVSQKMKEKLNIKWIGAALFVGACLFCLYYIWTVPSEPKPSKYFTAKLKLVNVFNRHGDRKFENRFRYRSLKCDLIELTDLIIQ